MRYTLALAALSAVASAEYFTGISARSASPVHLLPLTASGQRIYLGGNTASYCPENVNATGGCPPGKSTGFAATEGKANGTLSMAASVPGGQQVYVEPTQGAVMYTQAHSASMPAGAVQEGWTLSGPGSNGLGHLDWKSGLLACKQTANGPYEVYAVLEGVTAPGDCLGFDLLTSAAEGPLAWQYS